MRQVVIYLKPTASKLAYQTSYDIERTITTPDARKKDISGIRAKQIAQGVQAASDVLNCQID
jgi:hypothetical protein